MSQTRSPLKHPPQRLPGQSVRGQLVDAVFDKLGRELIAGIFGIYAMMEWIRWALHVVPGWRSCTLYTAVWPVLFLMMLPAFLDHEPRQLADEDARLIATHLKTFNRREGRGRIMNAEC